MYIISTRSVCKVEKNGRSLLVLSTGNIHAKLDSNRYFKPTHKIPSFIEYAVKGEMGWNCVTDAKLLDIIWSKHE